MTTWTLEIYSAKSYNGVFSVLNIFTHTVINDWAKQDTYFKLQ